MRRSLLAGVVLAVAAVLAVIVGTALDLDLESVTLLGASLGAVVALVPDRTPLSRLAGFGAGFLAGWVGYVVRAAKLPDTADGRAVAVGVVVLLAVGVTALSRDRLPLWSTLLGALAVAGAYEFTYAAAPPELASTSVATATTLLLTFAIGFLAAAVIAPTTTTATAVIPAQRASSRDEETSFEDLVTAPAADVTMRKSQ